MSARSGEGVVELDVMLTAQIEAPRGYVFRAPGRLGRWRAGLMGGEVVRMPCLSYVVRHPQAGVILIDTGLHPDALGDLRSDFGTPMSLLFRGLKPASESFPDQLRGLGVEPGEVGQVLMTHLHVDHTSGMRLLSEAEFVCSRPEWMAARGRFAVSRGYVRGHLPSQSRMRLVDFDSGSEPHEQFTRTLDLLGDGSVRLLFTPGHTAGHMSVLLRVAGGRLVLVVGDAAYILRNITEEILPMLTADDDASRNSMREIKAFAEAHPEAILVPTHDPTAWHELRHVSDSAARALAAASA